MQLINNFKIGLTELQRGVGNVNPMKMARCIMELERIYGIRQGSASDGSNQYIKRADPNNLGEQKSQSYLANQLGLERIYGIRQGSAGKVSVLDGHNVVPKKSQDDLANQC